MDEDIAFEELPYKVINIGGRNQFGSRVLVDKALPIYLLNIHFHKDVEIDYLIATSDLQGHILENGEYKLLGEELPSFLSLLFDLEFPQIDKKRVGVLLCGDLYADMHKRGGLGDVKGVWRAFNDVFGFVAGVAGNHDDFGDYKGFNTFKNEKGINYINRKTKNIKGLNISGLSGIIGRTDKPFRNDKEQHLRNLKELLLKQPDVLLLHEGPNNLEPDLIGNDDIRQVIEQARNTTIFCGHKHWEETIIQKPDGVQIINVDGKCLILKIV